MAVRLMGMARLPTSWCSRGVIAPGVRVLFKLLRASICAVTLSVTKYLQAFDLAMIPQ